MAEVSIEETVLQRRRDWLKDTPDNTDVADIVTGTWSLVAASVRGPGHKENGTCRQDAFATAAFGDAIVACVCDGLGSEARSHVGALLAARTVASDITAWLENNSGVAEEAGTLAMKELTDVIQSAISRVVCELEAIMEMEPGPGFGATLIGVVARPTGGLFFHVGDGIALAYEHEPSKGFASPVVSKPENGDFDNITFPITFTPLEPHLRFTPFDPAALIVLMSDGPMAFALDRSQAKLSESFYAQLSVALWPEVASARAGAMLANVLNDPRAGLISDDDKTLILIKRSGDAPMETADDLEPAS